MQSVDACACFVSVGRCCPGSILASFWSNFGSLGDHYTHFEVTCFIKHTSLFKVFFCDIVGVFEKGAEMELPERGWICNPTMPAHVS